MGSKVRNEVKKNHDLLLKVQKRSQKEWETEAKVKLSTVLMAGTDKDLEQEVLDVLRNRDLNKAFEEFLLKKPQNEHSTNNGNTQY